MAPGQHFLFPRRMHIVCRDPREGLGGCFLRSKSSSMHAMGSADGEIPFSLALVKNRERRSSG